tara:strand:- start:633 stop:836 length:204 start_codon:yes stop_codon:yes gene_type:complete
MAIKQVKTTQPVDGPYQNTRYTAKVKQGKNNTFTWTEQAENYDGPSGGVYTKTIQGYTHPGINGKKD